MAEINDLNVTDASNTARFPENQNPSTVNDGARALEGMVARWHKDTNGSVAVSGTDTYTATINADSGFALYDGFEFWGDFANANTGACTLNLTPDGGTALGAVSIKKNVDEDPAAGDIHANGKHGFIYDGTNFQMVSPVANGAQADVITTRGDVIRGSSSGAAERLAKGTVSQVLGGNGTDTQWVSRLETIGIACSDEDSDLTTGTAKSTFRMPYAFTLTDVRASVTTAPTGATITVDINESGTTILSTKLTIDASEKTSTTAATAAVISDASLADDAEMTIDIDQVGSTVAGTGLKVYLIGYQT